MSREDAEKLAPRVIREISDLVEEMVSPAPLETPDPPAHPDQQDLEGTLLLRWLEALTRSPAALRWA